MILAIETSCDDSCAAVVDADGRILSNVISSQGIHNDYGGVVPELAARAHVQQTDVVVKEALLRAQLTLDAIQQIAVTAGPGLIGALMVGVQTAKSLAVSRNLPLIAVDHLDGHCLAATLQPIGWEPPFLSLVASGGHTFIAKVESYDSLPRLGSTLDDAAGEAIDKGARLLGLPYPGGPALEKLAATGDPHAFDFPTADRVRDINFSFAGLKTALLYKLKEFSDAELPDKRADLAASYQRAVVEALAIRVKRAVKATGINRLSIGGGVAANSALRERLAQLDLELALPEKALCTDNAAMIAGVARFRTPLPAAAVRSLDVYATGQKRAQAADR